MSERQAPTSDPGTKRSHSPSTSKRRRTSMKVKTNIKSGGVKQNHNQTAASGHKSCVKSGDWPVTVNYNQAARRHQYGMALALALITTLLAGAASAQPYQIV